MGEVLRLKLSVVLSFPNYNVALGRRAVPGISQEVAAILASGDYSLLDTYDARWKAFLRIGLSREQQDAI